MLMSQFMVGGPSFLALRRRGSRSGYKDGRSGYEVRGNTPLKRPVGPGSAHRSVNRPVSPCRPAPYTVVTRATVRSARALELTGGFVEGSLLTPSSGPGRLLGRYVRPNQTSSGWIR